MMRPNASILPALALGCAYALALPPASADQRPDFNGLWIPTLDDNVILWPEAPPYTPWGQAQWDAWTTDFDPVVDDPSRFCVNPGMPRSMTTPRNFPIEIIQRDHDVTVFMEAWSQYRKIWMDGHDRPPPVLPSRMGYSVGRWEGDTLVVETTHLSERLQGQILLSDEARIEERMRLALGEDGEKRLVNDIRVTDPKTYAETVHIRGVLAWSPDTPIMEYVCAQEIHEDHLHSVRERRRSAQDAGAR